MATIPNLPDAKKMVNQALAQRAPAARAKLKAAGALPEFLTLHATAMRERMIEAWTPPNPGAKQPLPEAMRDQAEALSAAVEAVQTEMMSEQALQCATSSQTQPT